MNELKRGKSQKLWDMAKEIIPGGSQLLSKRAEMFLPGFWPAYYKKAKGAEVTDLDGNKFIDISLMGIGACVLGYADPQVNRAVKKVVENGSMSTLNSPEEVELSKLMLKLNPWAGMVRLARTGGEAMAIAVRIARAKSGREQVAFCGYHGWSDWYLASNLHSKKNLDGHLLPGLASKGVPRGLRKSALPFKYNDLDALKKIIKENKVGVISMEVMRHQEPDKDFLAEVRKIANKNRSVLIFDEITSGFRSCLGGVYSKYKVTPDIVVFGKGIANGYPMAVVVGKKKIMNAAQDTFISSTFWTERIGPAAALATLKKMKTKKVPAHINKIGELIWQGWEKAAKKTGLDITVIGPPSLVTFSFNYRDANLMKTLYTQEMLKRGFLATVAVYVSYAHKPAMVKKYLKAAEEVFGIIKQAHQNKQLRKLLQGPPAHTGFFRLT